MVTGSLSRGAGQANPTSLAAAATAPTGSVGQSAIRPFAASALNALTSGVLFMVAVPLQAGAVVTNITFLSSTQAAVAPTNQWFGLFDSARVCLKLTADDTNTAWSSSTAKTLALSAAHTTTYAGLHYVGIMVAAGTVPNLLGVGGSTAVNAVAPIVAGSANSAQTTPPGLPFTASAITATGNLPWCYLT